MPDMNIILFFQSTLRKSWREKLAGVFRFAQERDWLVQVVERTASPADIRAALETWCPIGCLVDRAMDSGPPPDDLFGELPVVYLDQDPAYPSAKYPCVLHDSAATARLAAEELLSLGYSSFGYFGPTHPYFWSRERAVAFRDTVQAVGHRYFEYKGENIQKWLRGLPKPCGILAANDYEAQRVHHAAQTAGLKIPDEIAIVGIDNDELYCEMMKPGITSVQPDFESAGYRLASLLARTIDFPGTKPLVEMYGPCDIIRRGSTRIVKGTDIRVKRALEFIRKNACSGAIGIEDVLRVMNCSRRLATLRFRETVGHSILDEIHIVRFERACKMLRETDKPIEFIISACGYVSGSFLKKYFRQRMGCSMRDYRKKQASGCKG